jgi:hypothetical protein
MSARFSSNQRNTGGYRPPLQIFVHLNALSNSPENGGEWTRLETKNHSPPVLRPPRNLWDSSGFDWSFVQQIHLST